MSAAISAVVVAAGRSRRMGFDKLLTPLAGQPLLCTTLQRLSRSPDIGELILVTRPEQEDEIRGLLAAALPDRTVRLVHGGAERQDSVQAGLAAVSPSSDYVLIQDAARPFVTPELVSLILTAARETGAAVCGLPCSDTLKEVASDGQVRRTVDRNGIWAVQTPQIFRKSVLAHAYQTVRESGRIVTDDTAAVELAGGAVRVVLYQGMNLKVTTPLDWKLAEAYLACEPTFAQVS